MSREWENEQAVSVVLRGKAQSYQFSEMRPGYKRAENNCDKWGKGLERYSRDLRKRTRITGIGRSCQRRFRSGWLRTGNSEKNKKVSFWML